jgi:hypothetical protein
MSLQDAASNTWTGRIVAKYGFKPGLVISEFGSTKVYFGK